MSRERASTKSAVCEPTAHYDFENNNLDYLMNEIDKFLDEYTPDGHEVMSSNTNQTDTFDDLNEVVTTNNVINEKNSTQQHDIEYVGQNLAVFELLEDHETFGIYEHNPNECNWTIFYKTLPDDQQNKYIKKEPGTDITFTNYMKNLSNVSFSQLPNIKVEPQSTEEDDQTQEISVTNENRSETFSANSTNAIVCTQNEMGNIQIFNSNNQNSSPVIEQNDLNEISQFWNQPINIQQTNRNEDLQIQNFKNTNKNVEIPITNPDYSIVQKYQTRNNIPVKTDNITKGGRRWNYCNKQNNYTNASNTPHQFQNKNHQKWSDGWCKDSYSNNKSSKPNVCRKKFKPQPFYNASQKDSLYGSPYQSKSFNSHSIRFRANDSNQIPNKILPRIECSPRMQFMRNHNESNNYNGINESQNETLILQHKTNTDENSIHKFQQPLFVPPQANEPFQNSVNGFDKPQPSLNQSNQDAQRQNQCSDNYKFQPKHRHDYWKHNLVSMTPIRSNSYNNSSNNNTETQNESKNEQYNQYSLKKKIDKKKRIGIKDYKNRYANKEKNIDVQKSNVVNSHSDYSAKGNMEIKKNNYTKQPPIKNNKMERSKRVKSFNSTNEIEMQTSTRDDPHNDYSTKDFEIMSKNTQKKNITSHRGNNITSNPRFTRIYLVTDYLCPDSLVGCTVKFSSRKLANNGIRDKLYTALGSYGEIKNSWWTPDDMFFVTYEEREVAQLVYNIYPKNTNSSY